MADAAAAVVETGGATGGDNGGAAGGGAAAGGANGGVGSSQGAAGAAGAGGGTSANAGGAGAQGGNAGAGGANAGAGTTTGTVDKSGAAAGAAAGAAQAATDPNAAKVADVWGDKWRETYAGDDKAKLNVLSRYASAKDALDALFNLQEKIRSGEFKKAPGKDAKPEDVAAFRKDNGIPATPDDYLKALPDGLVLGDIDKDVMSGFLKDMHDKNASPDYVNTALQNYVKAQGIFQQKLERQDAETLKATQNELRKDWQGSDYDTNVTMVKSMIQANFPTDVQEALMNGRLGDEKTTPLLAHPAVIKAFANIGRMLNPTGTVTGGAGIDNVDTLNSKIKDYENRMAGIGPDGKANDRIRSEWYKDEKAQSDYRNLISARERLQTSGK